MQPPNFNQPHGMISKKQLKCNPSSPTTYTPVIVCSDAQITYCFFTSCLLVSVTEKDVGKEVESVSWGNEK